MVTGWAGNNYVTALTPDGIHPLWCSDENYPEDQFRVPGLHFMSSTRQQWNNTSRLLTDSNCDAVPENEDVSFPSTLLEGEAEITAFPVTLKIAENGFLLHLDWESRRFNAVEDGGVWSLVYEDARTDVHYESYLYFTTLISYTGGMIIEHPNGCYWSFDWHGSRITR
jgi:hypothetical protein